jgi:hypothetical protein
MRAESRCRVCLCVCTDEEHALTIEQADALKLDAATAVVCLDCLRSIAPRPAARVMQIGTVACELADRYPVAVTA